VRRPDVEAVVAAELAPDVEDEVVGIDEEVLAAAALDVVERGHRGEHERAGSDGAARAPDHDPEAVAVAEAREHVGDRGRVAVDGDGERRAAELP